MSSVLWLLLFVLSGSIRERRPAEGASYSWTTDSIGRGVVIGSA